MKKNVLSFLCILYVAVTFAAHSDGLNNDLYFTENKGQVSDQYQKPRPDILFSAGDGKLTFHLKRNGISYQQYRVENWMQEKDIRTGKMIRVANQTTIYRLDISWPGANTKANLKYGSMLDGYSNYYSDVCPEGVHNVRSYLDVTYENIYNGIDLKWYQKDGHLKYDYYVSPGADVANIQIRFDGAEKLSITKKGELLITTPLGVIAEEAPYVLQNGKSVKAYWKLKNNTASFYIPAYNKSLPLIIDPGVRIWGTYYGGSSDDVGCGISTDNAGNVYLAGYTDSNNGTSIATVGSFQSTYGGGVNNGYLAKFKNTGVRLWATYYGGAVREIGYNCSVDPAGNVFLCGHSITPTPGVIATPGGHQTVHGGNWDAFLVKFNSAGVRQWGTYYGNNLIEFGYCCTTDIYGNSYLTGKTSVPTGSIIATPGSHQANYAGSEDAFLVKFNANGVRVWGTYYGGEGADVGYGLDSDSQGNIYLVGHTSSTANIATPGAHQASQGNAGSGWDAFVAKFNNSGVRIWGSYYGGTGNDLGYGCAVTPDGSAIYMSGKTDSNNGNSIAIDGSHQSVNGGGPHDAFLVKFDAQGIRQWGTYYGGSGDDVGYSCSVNVLGYPYLSGYTGSSTGTVIATPGSHQPLFGGSPFDAFLVQFNPAGQRQWGPYYGGSNTEIGNFCATDNNYNVYITGVTDSFTTPDIASTNAHQGNYGMGFSDGFFARLYDCTPPPSPSNASMQGAQSLCTGNSTTLHATGTGSISWYATATSPNAILNGTVLSTPVLSAGTYTYYAGAATCTPNPVRTAIVVTVHPLPAIFVATSKTLSCPGESVTLSSAGVPTYTWSTGSNVSSTVVSPTVTTTYSVSGTSAYGCVNTAVITQSVGGICVGIDEESAPFDNIVIFPNPSRSQVAITHLPSGASVNVFNILGEHIITLKPNGPSAELNLEPYSDGVYFIKIRVGDKQSVFKLVKN